MISAAWRARVRALKRDILALYLAARHRDSPWLAKLILFFVLAYALSPIDLIPDFIPVLGWVDELLLLPAALWLAVRLVPAGVLSQCRAEAELQVTATRPRSWLGAGLIVLLWIGLAAAAWLLWHK